jgi:hypothetical protein
MRKAAETLIEQARRKGQDRACRARQWRHHRGAWIFKLWIENRCEIAREGVDDREYFRRRRLLLQRFSQWARVRSEMKSIVSFSDMSRT